MTDRMEIAGGTALITGAGKRIGAAVATALAQAGLHVVLHYRESQAEAETVAATCRAAGVRATLVQADLSNPQAGTALIAEAIETAGPLDILVNCASIFPEDTLASMDAAAVHENVDINALAPLYLCRAFAAQGRPGAIVNFLDTMMQDYDQKHVPYHLSKRMLYTLTRIMAVEFAPGIRVNAVAPGLALPPVGKDESYLAGLAHSNPLKRYGSVDGLCDAVLFLLRSGFVTGQVIYVDGGRHLRGSMYD